MYSLLLAIIYLSFISLGLPDSLLGSAWPVMSLEIGAPLSWAGFVSMIISSGTVFASLFADSVTKKLGTEKVTAFSVLLTAVALFGFSRASSYLALCLLAVPYGLGAGAVDAALNNFVALHYKSSHMNWLHCFWGVGATISPYIMGWALSSTRGWEVGYSTVSLIQFVLCAFLFLTLPLWKKTFPKKEMREEEESDLSFFDALRIKGVKGSMIAFFCYCALETSAGLWASTYLVSVRGVDEITAAHFASMFYLGITVGRLFSGFVANRVGDRNMVRSGVVLMALGVFLLLFPTKSSTLALWGLVITGVGGAPFYPALIHSTPTLYGRENSHAIVGIQMAAAYTGSTVAPSIFGLISGALKLSFYPVYLALFVVLMILFTERENLRFDKKNKVKTKKEV